MIQNDDSVKRFSNSGEQGKEINQNEYDPGLCIKNCPICHGLGWIRYDVSVHHDKFGKLDECPNRAKRGWDSDLGISVNEALTLNWNEFIETDAVVRMRGAYSAVFKLGHGWVYIYGVPGNGKTIMAKAAAVYARQKLGMKVRYRKLSQVMNNLRSSYDDDYGQIVYQDRLKEWSNVPVLILDEIGRDRQTEFSKQTLSDIMDVRYENALKGKSITVWIGNFAPEDILEPYQVDRVKDGRFWVVKIAGKSVRSAMKETRKMGGEWWQD